MTGNLGGPREGNCRTRSFTVIPGRPYAYWPHDDKDLGVMPWDDPISMVEDAGGTRPTFDLFDLPPNPDGTFTRIRVVQDGATP
jgi:hypothetical protein